MRSCLTPIVLLAVLAPVAVTPGFAAQVHHEARADAFDAKLSTRINAIDAKLAAAVRTKRMAPGQSAALRKKVAWVRADSAKYVKQQGFLSAGEAASYNHSLDQIEAKLG